jgi:putative ABC transport system ATP-binding protein
MSLVVEGLCWGHAVPGGGRRELFRNFDFQSRRGEFTVVIGSNGSGKSTFLNLLAGTLRCDSGSIRLNDQPLQKLPDHRRARRIGRVMQNPLEGTCPGLTIAENLRLAEGRRRSTIGWQGLRGIHPNQADRRRYRDLLEQLGLPLADRLDSLVGLLSGGQRQTISLVMASLGNPELLLLDEHTAALDPKAEAMVMALTDRLVEQLGCTTLMVTHSLSQALRHGDRLVMLHDGQQVGGWDAAQRQQLTTEALQEMYGAVRVSTTP